MPPNMRPLMRVARVQSAWSRNPHFQRAFASSQGQSNPLPGGTPGESSVQTMPIGPYYESILVHPQPIPEAKPEEPPTSSPKSPRATSKKSSSTTPKSSKTNSESSSSSSSSSSGTTASTTTTKSTASSTSSATTSTVPPQPTAEPASAQEKARIIFGSRLAGPAERADRLQAIRERSVLVAGVLVPPRPEEPDNCCMSGCVNCVWDRYGEELEAWAAASARAEEALQAQRQQKARREGKVDVGVNVMGEGDASGAAKDMPSPSDNAAMSMDDDGGGSESNWRPEDIVKAKAKTDRPKIARDLWDDELYRNVPVGIREFMKQEKRLKEKHRAEGTLGG
ncbi:oxidoreductase-like protein [Xylaria sp. FL0933]|nr:oxidoreductase-like protein [Xylaria sp. FL0933]